MEKRITIPVRYFEKHELYEINVPKEYWKEFSEILKTVAKLKEKHITFKIKKL